MSNKMIGCMSEAQIDALLIKYTKEQLVKYFYNDVVKDVKLDILKAHNQSQNKALFMLNDLNKTYQTILMLHFKKHIGRRYYANEYDKIFDIKQIRFK